MDDINIPPAGRNEGIKNWLLTSVQLRSELLMWATRFANEYRMTAPTGRSETAGRLKAGAVPGVQMGDWRKDRPIGTVKNRVHYAVWNLTGAGPGMHTRSTGRTPRYGPFKGDFTFETIIRKMQAS